jgi:hypothetical protein
MRTSKPNFLSIIIIIIVLGAAILAIHFGIVQYSHGNAAISDFSLCESESPESKIASQNGSVIPDHYSEIFACGNLHAEGQVYLDFYLYKDSNGTPIDTSTDNKLKNGDFSIKLILPIQDRIGNYRVDIYYFRNRLVSYTFSVTEINTETVTPYPSLTATFESTATLYTDKLYNDLFFLLQDENCALPCLMGFDPTISTTTDIQNVLSPFQVLTKYGSLPLDSEGGLSIEYPSADMRLSINFYYFPSSNKNGTLDHIYLDTNAATSNGGMDTPAPYLSTEYHKLLQRYSLPVVLSTFGSPTQVLVSAIPSTGAEPGVKSFFDLRLAYPDKGFYLSYFSLVQEENTFYRVCPSDSFVTILSERPTSGMSLDDLIAKMDNWPGTGAFIKFKPISDATGITNTQFYQTFSQPTSECFESERSIWLKP